MSEQGYNGWTNYETWNIALWLDNEEPLYRAYQRMLPVSSGDLKEWIYSMFEENGGKFGDLDSEEELERVDWDGIVNSFNENYLVDNCEDFDDEDFDDEDFDDEDFDDEDLDEDDEDDDEDEDDEDDEDDDV